MAMFLIFYYFNIKVYISGWGRPNIMTGFTDGTFRKQLDQINCIISIFITFMIL